MATYHPTCRRFDGDVIGVSSDADIYPKLAVGESINCQPATQLYLAIRFD